MNVIFALLEEPLQFYYRDGILLVEERDDAGEPDGLGLVAKSNISVSWDEIFK